MEINTSFLTFVILGLIYIILQDKARVLDHLSRFGDYYQAVWLWIREKGSKIIRDEDEINDAWATHALIMLMVASQVLAFTLSYDAIVAQFGFIPAYAAEAWRWITHIFLHANYPIEVAPYLSMHLLGNIVFFYMFGDNVEEWLRRFRYDILGTEINIFAALFIIFGVIAAAVQATIMGWSSTVAMIGASGAISGIMGMYLVLFPNNSVYVGEKGPVPAYMFLTLWFVSNILSNDPVVATIAHAGGFAAGAASAAILRKVATDVKQR